MKTIMRFALSACLGLLSFAGSAADSVTVKISEVSVKLPVPEGFAATSVHAPDQFKQVLSRDAPSLRTLEYMAAKRVLDILAQGKPATTEEVFLGARTLTISMSRSMEAERLSKLEYQDAMRTMKPQMLPMMKSASERKLLESITSSGMQLVSLEPDGKPEFFHEDQNSIFAITTALGKASAGNATDNVTVSLRMIVGGGFVVVKGKMLYVFFTSWYESEKDIEWVKASTRDWVKELGRMNDMKYFR